MALVIGGAWNVWDDLRALEQLVGGPWRGVVCAVNDIGVHWPGQMGHWPNRIDHWVSLHPGDLRRWERERMRRHTKTWETWCGRSPKLVDHVPVGVPLTGSSSLFAARCMRTLNLRTVFCGVPMTAEPHFKESKVHAEGVGWSDRDEHWEAWLEDQDEIRGYCRSMSGDTRKLIEAPTKEWVYGG